MGVIYTKNAPIVDIHKAYGIELKGEIVPYESIWNPEAHEVIERLWVNGKEINLAGNEIYPNKIKGYINMEEDKDALCYWLSKNDYDDWELERFFLKEYHGSLWRHRVREWQLRERQEEENKRIYAEREEKKAAKLEECKTYAIKKKLYMVLEYDTVYFIKASGENKKAIESGRFDDADILRFAREYPGNGVEIVETREVA